MSKIRNAISELHDLIIHIEDVDYRRSSEQQLDILKTELDKIEDELTDLGLELDTQSEVVNRIKDKIY